MSQIIIVDIDWTIADHSHRLHHITGKVKDWPRYNALAKDDAPINEVIAVIESLVRTYSNEVVFITWRTEELRYDTDCWIDKYMALPNYTLHMRAIWDHREDTVIKKEILDQHYKQTDIAFVFEDRPRVCKMRRDLWLYVFNCDQSWKFF